MNSTFSNFRIVKILMRGLKLTVFHSNRSPQVENELQPQKSLELFAFIGIPALWGCQNDMSQQI